MMSQPDVAVRKQTQCFMSIRLGFRNKEIRLWFQHKKWMNGEIPACTYKNIKYSQKRPLNLIQVKAVIILCVKSHLFPSVGLVLCINGFMLFSHVMIADILLSEISLNMSIVTEMLGYKPLCLRVRERERWGRERRVWRRHKQREEEVIIFIQFWIMILRSLL